MKNINWNTILGIGAIVAIVIAALCIFLFTPDNGYTGVDALKDQSTAFWVWVIVGIVVAGISIYIIFASDKKGWGTVGLSLALVIVAVMFLFNPFGRACTDKANGGVTAPKHVTQ